jgi:hypothetical protein
VNQDKRPTNALIATAVELCEGEDVFISDIGELHLWQQREQLVSRI